MKPFESMTPYERFSEKWGECKRCHLWKARQRIVLCGGGPHPLKGSIPADVLFVGEAPGDSEDMLGQPFVGPAGYLLASILKDAEVIPGVRYCLTNLICCFPRSDEGSKKAGEPPKESIVACRPRLVEFAKLVKPRLVVTVGKLAEQYCPFGRGKVDGSEWLPEYLMPLKTLAIIHPAAILRADVSMRQMLRLRAAVALQEAIAGL